MRSQRTIRRCRWRWALIASLVACCAGAAGADRVMAIRVEGKPPEPTALEVRAVGPPRHVYGSDGREHVDYDLVITNAFTAEVTLTSLTVEGEGTTLLRLTGDALVAHTHQIIPGQPSAHIPASSTVVTLVDVVLPHSAGRTVPGRLINRIDYAVPPNAPFRAVLGSTTIPGPVLRTDRRAPIVIASPLRGSGWLDGNGCCADPSSPHRAFVVSANGTYVMPEMFAIDWVQVVDGSLFHGTGKQLSDYAGFGAQIYAAANGTVVSTIDDRPEVPPGESSAGNPTVHKPKDFGGNEVVEKIAPGVYAAYEHIKTGSIIVSPGQRLRMGQPIAQLGNTGNTTAPHLHFGIQDGPDILTSNALPFEIDNYTSQGTVNPDASPSHIVIIGSPREERRSYPVITSVSAFTSRAPSGG